MEYLFCQTFDKQKILEALVEKELELATFKDNKQSANKSIHRVSIGHISVQ